MGHSVVALCELCVIITLTFIIIIDWLLPAKQHVQGAAKRQMKTCAFFLKCHDLVRNVCVSTLCPLT